MQAVLVRGALGPSHRATASDRGREAAVAFFLMEIQVWNEGGGARSTRPLWFKSSNFDYPNSVPPEQGAQYGVYRKSHPVAVKKVRLMNLWQSTLPTQVYPSYLRR